MKPSIICGTRSAGASRHSPVSSLPPGPCAAELRRSDGKGGTNARPEARQVRSPRAGAAGADFCPATGARRNLSAPSPQAGAVNSSLPSRARGPLQRPQIISHLHDCVQKVLSRGAYNIPFINQPLYEFEEQRAVIRADIYDSINVSFGVSADVADDPNSVNRFPGWFIYLSLQGVNFVF